MGGEMGQVKGEFIVALRCGNGFLFFTYWVSPRLRPGCPRIIGLMPSPG
jgi:hypothetical protein